MRWAAWLLLAFASLALAQSFEEAQRAGRAADAAALRRFVASGQADLVRAFGSGLSSGVGLLPEEIEAIVVAHFDAPQVGAALRQMPLQYRSRALFDKHRARIEATYELNEPSFGRILATSQEGIDEELMRLAPRLPRMDNGLDMYTDFVARRRHPAALEALFAALPEAFRGRTPGQHIRPVELLKDYPDPAIQERLGAELDRLLREGHISRAQHTAVRRSLDAALQDRDARAEHFRREALRERFSKRVAEIGFNYTQVREYRESDPQKHFRVQKAFAERKEVIAREVDVKLLGAEVGEDFFRLGMFARFRLRDIPAAEAAFRRAGDLGHELGLVALGDIYQHVENDPAKAAAAYREALKASSGWDPIRMRTMYAERAHLAAAWWRSWLSYEIEFLDGRRTLPALGEAEIGGFFEAAFAWSNATTDAFRPEIFATSLRPWAWQLQKHPSRSWAQERFSLGTGVWELRASDLEQKLAALPPSRLVLMSMLRHASAMTDPQKILDFFARHDPSGYWSACVFATIAHLDTLGEARKSEAVLTESAVLLPGMASADEPRALSVAAQRFLEARRMKVVPAVP